MYCQVKDTEVVAGESIMTYDLITQYQNENPEKEIMMVIGEDLLPTLHTWSGF